MTMLHVLIYTFGHKIIHSNIRNDEALIRMPNVSFLYCQLVGRRQEMRTWRTLKYILKVI